MDIITLALAKKIAEEKALAATENLLENVYTKTAIDELASEKADLVDGKVPASQLPSYVDDVLSFPTLSSFPSVGESGKIYIALDTNKTYRWTGSGYVVIGGGLALGETSSTAYRGDHGKTAYDHSQEQGNAHNLNPDEISYDGTISGLSSTNVKTAIDELSSDKANKTYVDAQDALKADKTTTVNGKALSSNIVLAVEDIEGLQELLDGIETLLEGI